ncbi:hypothetical protein AVEN_172529-1 [Araneus ventricosus]|uniref:Uncharacterized protein n=1 Tax=Araneus ventricosus TaxID=182803 RepID=A0A4Y2K5U7_ARAVE|nr:hypothetical protein AVEN_172529-1 [Araneus ventricosus]
MVNYPLVSPPKRDDHMCGENPFLSFDSEICHMPLTSDCRRAGKWAVVGKDNCIPYRAYILSDLRTSPPFKRSKPLQTRPRLSPKRSQNLTSSQKNLNSLQTQIALCVPTQTHLLKEANLFQIFRPRYPKRSPAALPPLKRAKPSSDQTRAYL